MTRKGRERRSRYVDYEKSYDGRSEERTIVTPKPQCMDPTDKFLSILQCGGPTDAAEAASNRNTPVPECVDISNIHSASSDDDSSGFVDHDYHEERQPRARQGGERERESSRKNKTYPGDHNKNYANGVASMASSRDIFTVATEDLTAHGSSGSRRDVRYVSRRSKDESTFVSNLSRSIEGQYPDSIIPQHVHINGSTEFSEQSFPSVSTSSRGDGHKKNSKQRRNHRRHQSFDASGLPDFSHSHDQGSIEEQYMQSMIRQAVADGRRVENGITPQMGAPFHGIKESTTTQHQYDHQQHLTQSFDALALQDEAKLQSVSRATAPPSTSMASRGNPHAKYGHFSYDGSEMRHLPVFPEQGQKRHSLSSPPIPKFPNAGLTNHPHHKSRSKRSPQRPPTHNGRHQSTGSMPTSALPNNVSLHSTTSMDEAMAKGFTAGALEFGESSDSPPNIETQVTYDASTISTSKKPSRSSRRSSRSRQVSSSLSRRLSSSKSKSLAAAGTPSSLEMCLSYASSERSRSCKAGTTDPGSAGMEIPGMVEFHVPAGDLGVSLRNSTHGPVIAATNPRSIFPQMGVGDVIMSMDGIVVSHFPAEAVAKLIASRSQNPVRRIQCVPGRILD